MTTDGTQSKKRANLRLDTDLIRRVDSWAGSSGISRSAAVEELLRIGMDADTSGLESALGMQQQLRKEIASLRALVAESVTAGDTASALLLVKMANAGVIQKDKMIGTFTAARQMARSQLKPAKKSA